MEFLDVQELHFVETGAPTLRPEEQQAMDEGWAKAVQANPSLFDGPVVVCAGLDWKNPHSLVLTWYRAMYRLYVLRLHPTYAVSAPSVFVTVAQPTDDGRLLVGRMGASTVSAGRWQLPGGTIEPPAGHDALDTRALAGHAARELSEEVGIDVPQQGLELWAVTRGNWGNIGIHYRAPSQAADLLQHAYASLAATEAAHGRTPELDQIAFISAQGDTESLGGPTADFLPGLAALHAAGRHGRTE
ncbi:NUDIX domain-containing protein [Streptomyces sp. NPDC059991]|uniref:NUDIX domain-containing protein n=1 Tax=Streptomyces sp. NPDC059991 TaxID=3347028 RepID=UPI0036829243